MSLQDKILYEFGPFRLDTSERFLLRDGELIPIAPKAFETLLLLVGSHGRVLEKDDLLKIIWPDTFVEEGSLAQNISILRKALGEGANGQQYIQTIPKRGYRFVAPVQIHKLDATSDFPAVPTLNGHQSKAAPAAVPAKHFRRRIYAIAAVAVLAVAAGTIFLWSRHTLAQPLTDRDVLVLADFTNSTGDPVFDNTLREALAFQLEESPFLKVLDDVVVRQDLELMRRSPQERITNDLAHDICVREADKAMLGGSIASLGKTYVIELRATNCETGATLARQQAQASDKDRVLQALATAAQGMRAKLGESLSSIQKLAPPSDTSRVTTASLEAFQAFNTGRDLYIHGRYSEALPFLQRATELDPNLAMAWVYLGVAYPNSGGRNPERQREYGDRLQASLDRVSAYERLWITSGRGQTVGDLVEHYEAWARTYPRDAMPIIQLGRLYVSAGEFEKALPMYEEAYRLQSRQPIFVTEMMRLYTDVDRFDEARSVAERAFAQGVDAPNIRHQLLAIAYAQGDRAIASKQIQWFTGKSEEYASLAHQGGQAKLLGQMGQSRELFQHAADLARQRNLMDAAAGFLMPDASWDALLGNCEAARRANALSDAILALCGDAALVERAEEVNRQLPPGPFRDSVRVPLTRAAEEYGLGHPAKTVELLQSVVPHERAHPFANYLRGLAYLRLHKGTEAAAEFQKVLDHRGNNWGPYYPLSYVGLARATVLAGDTARAARAYRDFLDLWKDADPDVPFLIQVRKEFAGLLQ